MARTKMNPELRLWLDSRVRALGPELPAVEIREMLDSEGRTEWDALSWQARASYVGHSQIRVRDEVGAEIVIERISCIDCAEGDDHNPAAKGYLTWDEFEFWSALFDAAAEREQLAKIERERKGMRLWVMKRDFYLEREALYGKPVPAEFGGAR